MKRVRFEPSSIGKLTRPAASVCMLRLSLGNHNLTIRPLYLPIALGMDICFCRNVHEELQFAKTSQSKSERSDDFISYNNAENYPKVYAGGSPFLLHIQ